MQIKKLFTMKCYFCGVSETIEHTSQNRAITKFSDDGWRIRADEDVCPKCAKMLPLKVSRRELAETKARLLTQLAPDACPRGGSHVYKWDGTLPTEEMIECEKCGHRR